MEYLIIISTLIAMSIGGHHFVVGAARLGGRLGMSPVLIGSTIVALGTSLPEWGISVIAARSGAGGLSTGNVIGSNICNILVILGVAAIITPIRVKRHWISRDGTIMILITLAFFAVCADGIIERWEGGLLLASAVAILVYSIKTARPDEVEPETVFHWWDVPRSILGLVVVLVSSHFFVAAAQTLAKEWGVSPWVIGITVAAIGTSLPELVTAVAAALQKNSAMIVGNLIGSNTMNITFVLGSAALVHDLESDEFSLADAGVFLGLMVFAVAVMFFRSRVSRFEGVLLLGAGLFWYAIQQGGMPSF